MLTRVAVTLGLCLLVIILFEFYLRQTMTYVIQSGVTETGGFIDQNPEHLVQYSSKRRSFVPNASVIIKNHYLTGRDIEFRTNRFGFRDEELPEAKSSSDFRILVLGDSITAGDYLQASEVYVERIESELNSAGLGPNFEVINAGISNVGLAEEVQTLLDVGGRIRPDLVVVGFYLNDSRPPWGFSGEIGERGWLRRNSLLVEAILRNFELKGWVAKQKLDRFSWMNDEAKLPWATDKEAFNKLVTSASIDWGSAWNPQSWDSVHEQFRILAEQKRVWNLPILVTAFPVVYQVKSNFVDDVPQRKLESIAKEFGFDYLDLLPILRTHVSDGELFEDWCHPSLLGHEIIGKAITGKIKEIFRDNFKKREGAL